MDYPVHFAKGTNINRDFKVKVLPRLILVDKKGVVRSDNIYLEEKDLQLAIDALLAEVEKDSAPVQPSVKQNNAGNGNKSIQKN